MARTTTYRTLKVRLAKLTPNAIGIPTGEREEYVDPRDGFVVERDKLAFLSRRHVHVIQGRLVEGEDITLDVPTWLIERAGIKELVS